MATRRRATKRKQPETNELGLNIDLLEKSFAALAPQGEQLVARFYEELFKHYPEIKPLFKNADQKQQEKKLLASLQLVINNLRKPEVLGKALRDLGKQHQGYEERNGQKTGYFVFHEITLLFSCCSKTFTPFPILQRRKERGHLPSLVLYSGLRLNRYQNGRRGSVFCHKKA